MRARHHVRAADCLMDPAASGTKGDGVGALVSRPEKLAPDTTSRGGRRFSWEEAKSAGRANFKDVADANPS